MRSRTTHRTSVRALSIATAAALVVAACSADDNESSETSPTTEAGAPAVSEPGDEPPATEVPDEPADTAAPATDAPADDTPPINPLDRDPLSPGINPPSRDFDGQFYMGKLTWQINPDHRVAVQHYRKVK